jgi:dTDP-4-dehydrorhamnose reductase
MPLRPVDLADPDGLADAFREARPAAVIHAGALATVAACHGDPERAWAVNVRASTAIAELSARAGARLLLVSTDLVFDGEQGWYREADAPAPLSVYGQTKAAAEQAVLAAPRSVVVRVSLLFGPTLIGRPAFFDGQLAALRERRPVTLFEDEWRTPLSLVTAARALAALVRSDCTGVLHLGGPERLSRLDMGRRLAAFLGADPSVLVPTRRQDAPAPERRPRDTSLRSDRWRELFPGQPWPAWEDALGEMGLR